MNRYPALSIVLIVVVGMASIFALEWTALQFFVCIGLTGGYAALAMLGLILVIMLAGAAVLDLRP